MCPWGSSLLLGNANGGIRRLQIGSDDPIEHRPKLVEVSGQQFCMLAPGQHASRLVAVVMRVSYFVPAILRAVAKSVCWQL
jgi:hypothetical protein